MSSSPFLPSFENLATPFPSKARLMSYRINQFSPHPAKSPAATGFPFLPSSLAPFTTKLTHTGHLGLFARAQNHWAKPSKHTLWYIAQLPPMVITLTPATIAYLYGPMPQWERVVSEFLICMSERPIHGLLYLTVLLLSTTWRVFSPVVRYTIRWLSPDIDADDLAVVVLLAGYFAIGAMVFRVGRVLCL